MTAAVKPVDTSGRRFPQWLVLIVASIIGIIAFTVVLTVVLSAINGFTLEVSLAVATQQTANALSLGAIYALVALGYTMVYGIIELINFAHGDVFMIGAFVAMTFLTTGFQTNAELGPTVALIFLVGLAALLGWGLISGLGIKRAMPRLLALGLVILSVAGFWLVHAITVPGLLAAAMEDLFALVAGGRLRAVAGGDYPLSEARRAHEDLRARRTVGKLTLDPSR